MALLLFAMSWIFIFGLFLVDDLWPRPGDTMYKPTLALCTLLLTLLFWRLVDNLMHALHAVEIQ